MYLHYQNITSAIFTQDLKFHNMLVTFPVIHHIPLHAYAPLHIVGHYFTYNDGDYDNITIYGESHDMCCVG